MKSPKMVDLKRSKKERSKEMAPASSDPNRYPYGTRISLDHDEMEKLGMNKAPRVGDEVHVMAKGHVESASEHDHGDGPRRHVSIQLKHMGVKHKSQSGRAGGKDTDMQEGGKAAMDQALEGQTAAAQSDSPD
jgi:hypothetical protein